MITVSTSPRRAGDLLREFMRRESAAFPLLRVTKPNNVYACGATDQRVYLIQSGLVKVHVPTEAGKVCVQAIYSAGDIFGELCLSERERSETAQAMATTMLSYIPAQQFVKGLMCEGMAEDMARYLSVRLAEQQERITQLVTSASEQRVAAMLLYLGRKLGTPESGALRIDVRISHQELAEMVGTTRSRVGYFLKHFRHLGLLEKSGESYFNIREQRLARFLEGDAHGAPLLHLR